MAVQERQQQSQIVAMLAVWRSPSEPVAGLSDQELCRIVQTHRAAFDELVNRNRAAIDWFPEEDRSDILARLWKAAPRWKFTESAPSGIKTLVQYIGHSVRRDRMRKSRRHELSNGIEPEYRAILCHRDLSVEVYVSIEIIGPDAIDLAEAILSGDKNAVKRADPDLLARLREVLSGS
jgi:hypothetical protein